MKLNAKVLSIFLIIVLLESSIQTSFLNISQQTLDHASMIKSAFATSNDDLQQIGIYGIFGLENMEKDTVATGAFIANSIVIKQDSVISKDSAFNRPKITWTSPSLDIQARPFAPIQLNFTSNPNIQSASIVISNQIGALITAPKTPIDANALQHLPITISIPPNTSSGWHNGTITLFANNIKLSNSFFLNILVPTITSQTVQTSTGNLTYIATPSSSPFFTNTYDVATYFTFTNGTTIPIRAYYDVFTNLSTITPVSLHASTSGSSNGLMSTYDYLKTVMNKMAVFNFWQSHEASATTQASTCTNYAMTYHFQSYPSTVSNDLDVAVSALHANQNPLIIRNDIYWSDVDKGSFDSNGNWVPNYDDTIIDNYFNNVITSGKNAMVILGVHSPPGKIAEKGTNIFRQTYEQYAYANAANAFINHTINRIKTLGALDRVQSWQIDNEPNTHPMLKSLFNGGILTKVVDWQTTSSALNLWSSTVKALDPGKPIIINVYQPSPQYVIPRALQTGMVFSIKPFDNLLSNNFASSQQLAANISIMGFDIYPDQWVNPFESLTSGFNGALLQVQNQFTDVQNNYAFSGRWGIVEMPSGPRTRIALAPPVTIHASDISNMISVARNTLINGQPPALIGLFQLRAPNDLVANLNLSNEYGLIKNSNGHTYSNFLASIKTSVVQNCPPPTGQLTVITKDGNDKPQMN